MLIEVEGIKSTLDVEIPSESGTVYLRPDGPDAVNHPPHYTDHPSGVECITITQHMNFCLGNAIKYVWRAGLKSENPEQDLQKAVWYINREIARLKANQ